MKRDSTPRSTRSLFGTLIFASAVAPMLALWGCDAFGRKPPADEGPYAEALDRFSRSLAIRGTIGEITRLKGVHRMRVRGYGLVVGLGRNGSKTCPTRVRKQVASEIRKKYHLGDSRIGLGDITPEKLINSEDTAVVSVVGEIGAAALRGTHFDLVIQALPGTETTSLEGGRLYTCDLRYFTVTSGAVVREGRIIAKGEGPIFTNPYGQHEDSATVTDLRFGRIIGGGTNLEDRVVKLVLPSPSYAMAIRIQDKINDRFSTGDRIATAETPAFVAIEIPPQFKGREAEFLALVRHLYVTQEAGFDDRRTAELATEILDPRAPHDNIALAWEGIGKPVKSTIRTLYDNAQSYVSFHAARTGLRLGDTLAIRVMERHAADPKSPYQEEAIAELGHAVHTYRAAKSLLRLIDQDLDRAALSLAYEGLVEHNDPALMSMALGGQFVLDRLDSPDAKAMIYAKIEDQARMVLFGDVRFKAPLFYRHAQGLITMNVPAEGEHMTLIRQTPGGRSSPTINAPLDVYEFIRLMGRKAREDRGQVTGLGLTYPQIIDIISSLCADGSIDADFRLERPEAADYARRKRVGRPESEL